MPSKNTLIDLYIASNFEDSSVRCQFKKSVTAYNKANKQDPLKMCDVFKRDYPRLYNTIITTSVINTTNVDDIIENNFTKLLKNLSSTVAQSSGHFENILRQHLAAAYPPGTILVNRISNLKYIVKHNASYSYLYSYAVCEDYPLIGSYLYDTLIQFKEF